ncbi:MAG: putative manganese transporter [Bacteroidales bacterium]
MSPIILSALKNSILITGLVMIMMLLIEYINIHTSGNSFRKLKDSSIKQIFIATLLGIIPGCVGGFAVVSLYTHRILSFGALVAMMIATSGDEAFFMLALIPKTAIILFIALFATAIIVGIVVDKFVKKEVAPFNSNHYQVHADCCSSHNHKKNSIFHNKIGSNLKNISKERALIILGILLFIAAIVMGLLEHDHTIQEQALHTHQGHSHATFDVFSERWVNLFFAGLSVVILLLTLKSNDHFIKEHLWNHVIRKHLKSIFLWTFGVLLVINFGMQFLHLEEWIAQNMYVMILLAVLVGLIPESGPHMVFITLFSTGIIPFSVLFASSIVQDGHAALPLLAESKRSFFKAKAINMAVGLIMGVTLHLFGL